VAEIILPDKRLADFILDTVRVYRDRQPSEVERAGFDHLLFHELLIAAHACDGTRCFEERRARVSSEPSEVVLARIEVAGWKHLIHEATKLLHMAEDRLTDITRLK
jgi:hypothetical protein